MTDWQPSASGDILRARAELLAQVRDFFEEFGVLEVETPLLATAGVTDPNLQLFESVGRFLQTSPEYHMKRLLASGSGPIYQICKAFRQEEAGSRHNPEFTMLEWYQPGYDSAQLMDEVAALLSRLLGDLRIQRFSYRELFKQFADIDPFVADAAAFQAALGESTELSFEPDSRDAWCDLLLTHVIEPELNKQGVVFVYDYPASQAALAQLREAREVDGELVADRFEVYLNGMELANGYCELTDADEQRSRFEADNERITANGETERPLDEYLLAAMADGLPACSGVALGLDRLLMVLCEVDDIRQVLSFDWSRA